MFVISTAPDDIPFGITASSDVAKEYGITSEYGFVAVRTFDEPQVVYDSDNYSSDAIGRFALDNSLPLVIPFSQEVCREVRLCFLSALFWDRFIRNSFCETSLEMMPSSRIIADIEWWAAEWPRI